MKRTIIVALILILLSSLLPSGAMAATYSNKADFLSYLDSQGIPGINRSGREANYHTYNKYNLVVYGDPWGDSKPSSICPSIQGTQTRYLGYTFLDEPYTNSCFPPDVSGSNGPESWNKYLKPSFAVESWGQLLPSQRDFMRAATLSGNGASSASFTANYISSKMTGNSNSYNQYTKVQSPALWRTGGSIYTEHLGNNNKVYYATFTTPPMVGNTIVSGEINTPNGTSYVLTNDKSELEIPYSVTARANISGSASENDVMTLRASSGFSDASNRWVGQVTLGNQKHVLNRSDYPASSTDQRIPVQLKGKAYIKNIFGEEQEVDITKTVNVTIQPVGTDPVVTASASTNPNSVKFNNQNVNVTLTVSGVLGNYTNASNIKEWKFYARHREDTNGTTLKSQTIAGSALTKETSFNFTIPRSAVSGDSFTQNYITTATAVFNQPVFGKTQLSGTAEASTYVYKEIPPAPEPGNLPPVAVISGPTYIDAGSTFTLNGAGSYDPDGTIVNYFWDSPFCTAQSETTSTSAQFVCMNEGTYQVRLLVLDNKGDTGEAYHSINVRPPMPSAVIRFDGTLKENRKVTLDATRSYAPQAYGIDHSRTVWTISPISGGTVSDIKYSGSLSGLSTKDVLFKKAGDYLVTLTVYNSKGSNTATLTLTIKPDAPPVMNSISNSPIFRQTYYDNKALIIVDDDSYSGDGDFIASRSIAIAYDADNNGTCSNDTFTTVSTTSKHVEYYASQVGNYCVRVTATESFGEPTIPEFVSAADYKQNSSMMMVKVDNLPPVVSLGVLKKKKVDLVFNLADTNLSLNDLKNKVNSAVVPALSTEGIVANVRYIDAKPKMMDAFAYIHYWKTGNYSSDQHYLLYYYDPSSNTRFLVGEELRYSPEPIFSQDGVLYYIADHRRKIMAFDPKTRGISEVFTSSGDILSFTLASNNAIYYSRYRNSGYDLVKYDLRTKTTTELHTGRPNNHRGFADGFDGFLYYGGDSQDSYGNAYQSKLRLSDDYLFYNGDARTSTYLGAPFGRIIRPYNFLGDTYITRTSDFRSDYNLAGFMENVAVSFKEPVIYYSGAPGSFYQRQTSDLQGFFKFNYLDGSGEVRIDPRQVTIHGVSMDDKVYYSYKDTPRDMYVYNPANNSKTYLFTDSRNIGDYATTVRYQSIVPTPKSQSLSQSLSDLSWTEGADKYFIDVNNSYRADLDTANIRAKVLSELINNNVSYIQFGTSLNSGQAAGLIVQNDNKGKFYSTSVSIDTTLSQFRDDVISTTNLNSVIDQYLVLGDSIDFFTEYDDVENDPMMQERWRFDHTAGVYENNHGTISDNGVYRSLPIVTPEKVGRYEITYAARDNPKSDNRFEDFRKWSDGSGGKMTLYVHRKPLALYTASAALSGGNYSISINEYSYDLDHQSKANKGISQKVWRWKNATSPTWTNGLPPSTLPANQTYLVSLKVQDIEGAWSDDNIQTIGNTGNLPPIALFTVNPSRISMIGTYTISDQSRDPNGDPIAERRWTASLNGVQIYTGSTAPTAAQLKAGATAYGQSQRGTYTITLEVRDNPPLGASLWSEPYSQPLVIANSQPVANLTNPNGAQDNPTVFTTRRPTFTWTQTDADPGTTFTAYRLQITDETNTRFIFDTGDVYLNNRTSWTATIDLPTGDTMRARVRVFDGTEWSDWSTQRWFKINRPPTAAFDWAPKPVWEGDTIQLSNSSTDPDADALTYSWGITRPDGTSYTSTVTHPVIHSAAVGTYVVSLTASDSFGGSHLISRNINVGELSVSGDVRHTPAWDENRISYNQKQTGTDDSPRSYYFFWAGEKFVLVATTTDTGVGTQASEVIVTMGSYTVALSPTNSARTNWVGELGDDSFEKLADEFLTFDFTARWTNGTVKTDSRTILIDGNWTDYFRIHRVK